MCACVTKSNLNYYYDMADRCDTCKNDDSCCKLCLIPYAVDYAGMQKHYMQTGESLTHKQYTFMAENEYLGFE